MDKIPTAEEFRISQGISIEQDLFNTDLHELMIEFAKMHVLNALRDASENTETTYDSAYNVICDKESILNAYPLKNIK
jgi:hypothetical protein